MSLSSRPYVNRYASSNRFPAGVKWLLIVTGVLSVLDLLLSVSRNGSFLRILALVPSLAVQHFAVWQLVTYLFIQGGLSLIVWNMLALWMFGAELERAWGTARFVRFYFVCGIFAALAVISCAYLFGGVNVPVVGAAGSIYGLLMAYAVLFPDRTMLFGFLIPIKTRWFVAIIGGIVLIESYFATVGGMYGALSALAGLGGLLAGYIFLPSRRRRPAFDYRGSVRSAYNGWKLRRARKKFEVYLRKRDSDRDRTIH